MANSYEVLTTHTVDLGSVDLGSVDLGSVDLGSVDLGSEDLRSVDLSGCGEWTKTCEEECVDGGGPWVAVWQQEKLSSQRRYLHTVQEKSRVAGGVAYSHLLNTTLCQVTCE